MFVAIATPHSKSSEFKAWNQPQLLTGTPRFNKRRIAQTSPRDAGRLADLCLRFEGVATTLRILTLCETEETGKGLFTSKQLVRFFEPKIKGILQGKVDQFYQDRARKLLYHEDPPRTSFQDQG